MLDRICCPTCSMSAATTDHRHFTPLGNPAGAEARRCRNCGETILVDGLRTVIFQESRPRTSSQLSASF